MAVKKKSGGNAGYDQLRADLAAGTLGTAYIFHGEESYLREYYLGEMRRQLVPAGFEEFNYHRLPGKGLTVQDLTETVEAMPMMAQHTLVVVTDMDLFRLDEGQRGLLIELLGDFPEYCTLVFVYDVLAYKRDGKMKKLCAAIGDHVQEVEFCQQEREQLLRWMKRRFAAEGHDIGCGSSAVYLRDADDGPGAGDRKNRRLCQERAHHHCGYQRRGGPHSGCAGV